MLHTHTLEANVKMLASKALTAFSFVFLLFLGGCTSEEGLHDSQVSGEATTRDIGDSCAPDLTNCTPGVFAFLTVLPQYPTCEFEISLDYSLCNAFGSSSIHIGDFEIVFQYEVAGGLPCAQFESDLQNAMTNGTIDQFVSNFNSQIWDIAIENLLQSQITQGLALFTIEYNASSCYFYCINKVTKKGQSYDMLTRYACGDGCCKIITTYQPDNSGDFVQTNVSDLSDSDCGTSSLVLCPSGGFATSCQYSCSEYLN